MTYLEEDYNDNFDSYITKPLHKIKKKKKSKIPYLLFTTTSIITGLLILNTILAIINGVISHTTILVDVLMIIWHLILMVRISMIERNFDKTLVNNSTPTENKSSNECLDDWI